KRGQSRFCSCKHTREIFWQRIRGNVHFWQNIMTTARVMPGGRFRTPRKFARITLGKVARNYGKIGKLCGKAQVARVWGAGRAAQATRTRSGGSRGVF